MKHHSSILLLLSLIIICAFGELSQESELIAGQQLQELAIYPLQERQLGCAACPCTAAYATKCGTGLFSCTCYVWACSAGYYPKFFASSCTVCPTTIANCYTCGLSWMANTPSCTSCISGYTLMNNNCASCPNTCPTCSSTAVSGVTKVTCDSCISNLILQGSGVRTCGCQSNQFLKTSVSPYLCVACSALCLTCTDVNVCSSCNSGYYLQASTCLLCMPVCKTCTTGTTCATCQNNLALSAGICQCNSPYFYNSANKTCANCSNLQPNCQTCSYATVYDPSNPPAVVCSVANVGYYISGAGTALPCIANCNNCDSNPLLCDIPKTNFTFDGISCVCSPGYYYQSATQTCLACTSVIPGCGTCITNIIPTPTQCNPCDPTGYFSASYPTNICTACPSKCVTCNSLIDCTSCINNLTVLAGDCACDNTSSLYYEPVSKTCQTCSNLIFNCLICNANATGTTCASCVPNYYLTNNDLVCLACPVSCSSCLNSTYCSGCQLGYELFNNTCICGNNCIFCMSNSTDGKCSSCTFGPFVCTDCVAGYIYTAGLCPPCSNTWPFCGQCTAVACTTCLSPTIMTPAGCVCNNTAGQYFNLNLTNCVTCASAISNCLACTTSNTSTLCTNCANGYFLSNTSQACVACSGNCLNCVTSGSNCLSCLSTYSMVANNTCGCNTAAGYFYNPSTAGCSLCSSVLTNCNACTANATNGTECSDCSEKHYWNSSTLSCSSCSSACFNCSGPNTCSSCPNNLVLSDSIGLAVFGECVCDNSSVPIYYYDSLSGTCQTCSYFFPSCSACTYNSKVQCTSCAASTFLVNGTCSNCPSKCATCNETACLSCPGNQTLSNGVCICDAQCTQCQALSTGCISCLITAGAVTSCFACEPGTYLSSPNCQSCPNSCATCSDSVTCLTCATSYILINGMCSCATSLGIFPNSNGLCVPCSQIYYGCSECGLASGSTECLTSSPGYFVVGTSSAPCNTSCLSCEGTSSNCTSCLVGETLVNNTCVCTSADCIACSTISLNCSNCIYTIYGNFSKCDTCMAGYFLNGVNCTICPSVCQSCGTGGACLTCAATFQVINDTCMCNAAQTMYQSAGSCSYCTSLFPNCIQCAQNASQALNVTCLECKYGYYYQNSTCKASVCGDNTITSGQTCDDGNVISGDGCSSTCAIQANFLCTGQPSVCTMNLDFNITRHWIATSHYVCNQVSIGFKMHPQHDAYNRVNFMNMLNYISTPHLLVKSASYRNGIATYTFSYTSTLNNQNVTFYFAPASLGINQTSTVPVITVPAQMSSDNNIAVIYYEASVCQSKANMKGLTDAVEYASYGALALSAFPCKIVGLELFGVLQLAFINVGNLDNVNTMMTPLAGLKGVHGFKADIGQDPKSSRLLAAASTAPARVQTIGYQANFLRNCNVMLLIVVIAILVSLLLYALTYCCRSYAPSLHSISKRIIKEVLLTLILFNCFNFAYSAGLHFNYDPHNDNLYTFGTIAAVLALVLPVVMAVALMCTEDQGFGEYKEKFKPGVVERSYFVVTIIYRSGIGLYISTMNQDALSALIVMAFSIAFLLYNLVNLPYSKAYHNYRANVCHLTQFISLFVTMYYRSMMSSNTTEQMATVFTPAYLLLACITISLIVSMIVLVYEIYLFIHKCLNKKEKRNESEEVPIHVGKNFTQENMENMESIVNNKQKNFVIDDMEE